MLSPELQAKYDDLLNRLQGYGRVAVAFSGGVDSTVVAQAAQLACGDRAVAVTAVSDSLPAGMLEQAEQLARQIGIRHQTVRTDEFQSPGYVANASNRCYFCKTELYQRLEELAPTLGVDVLVNGANLDDRGDYRPGMQAAAEFQVRSPLIETHCTKADVRALAQHWGLPNWDQPASPCLSSRVAYGVEVTPERVRRIDDAESFLRQLLAVRELRVRLETNDLARIEVPVAALPRLTDDTVRAQIVSRLRELGFRYVTLDLEGFRSGSLNGVLPLSVLELSAAKQRSSV